MRLLACGLRITHFQQRCTGRYQSLEHERRGRGEVAPKRMEILRQSVRAKAWQDDGLSSLRYRMAERRQQPHYLHLLVDLLHDEQLGIAPKNTTAAAAAAATAAKSLASGTRAPPPPPPQSTPKKRPRRRPRLPKT